MTGNSEIALKTNELTIQFGGLKAVQNLNLEIPKGAIYGLIGPNGAGKTTLFNMLTGVYTPTSGEITLFGTAIQGKKPYQINSLGLGRTFQNIRLFKNISVLDNVLIALDQRPKTKKFNFFAQIMQTPAVLKNETAKLHETLDLLKIFALDTRADELAGSLPYGDQRRLEIIRALATGANMLLLDEPAAGMNSKETASLMETIKFVREHFKRTILLIEHDMRLVMGICERIIVVDYGIKIAEGSPHEIKNNPQVLEAYLGKAKA